MITAAANSLTFPTKLPGLSIASILMAAYPKLSEDTSRLVMFMLVVCTANQFSTPWREPSSLTTRTWVKTSSVLDSYLEFKGYLISNINTA